jgi:hypothetical protein
MKSSNSIGACGSGVAVGGTGVGARVALGAAVGGSGVAVFGAGVAAGWHAARPKTAKLSTARECAPKRKRIYNAPD